jgi:uroporphyrinogen-III synthase
MQENNFHILSTRPVDPLFVRKAGELGVHIDMLPFIETESLVSETLRRQLGLLADQPMTAVFTSMNAVQALAAFLKPASRNWKVFCLGNTTRKLVAELFGEDSIAGTAASASGLARQMLEAEVREAFFFCGDQRREELPAALRKEGVDLKEIVVYRTVATAHLVEKPYDGISFFSPSAVHSFFSLNQPGPATVLFAIGETTASAIREYSNNELITGLHPDKESLLEEAIAYFCNKTR